MYKPEYRKYFFDELHQTMVFPVFSGDEYQQWKQKNIYTKAIDTILFFWGWPLIYPLIDRGMIKTNEDDSLDWEMKNLDSLARLFHDWPMDVELFANGQHIPGGFWRPVETAFKLKRGSLRYLVSTGGCYYDRINLEYQKVIAVLREEIGNEWFESETQNGIEELSYSYVRRDIVEKYEKIETF